MKPRRLTPRRSHAERAGLRHQLTVERAAIARVVDAPPAALEPLTVRRLAQLLGAGLALFGLVAGVLARL